MKKMALVSFMMLLVAGFVSGCASSKVSKFGFTDSAQAVSVPNGVEVEKNGDQYVTVFPIIADPGFFVEIITKKTADGYASGGVWPVLSRGSKIIRGYAFLSDLNWWGDFILQVVMVGKKSDLGEIICLNRDGGWVYDLKGQEFEYDPKKFDEDLPYQKEIFEKDGMSLAGMETFWRDYSQKRGIEVDSKYSFAEEIQVGSERWGSFKTELAARLGNNYKMPNGEIRSGYFPLEDFRREASQNNGATSGQKFLRNAYIPVAIDPFSAGIGVVSALLNGTVAASSGSLEGFYARAECLRKDLKLQFRQIAIMYKQLLQQRDAVIYELQQNQKQ